MKKLSFLSAVLAVALVFGLALASCDLYDMLLGNDGTGNGPPEQPPKTPVYTMTTTSGDYVEIFFSNMPIAASARAVLSGDYFEIRLNSVVISRGQVQVNGSSITFYPSNGSTFQGTLGNNDVLTVPSIPLPGGGTLDFTSASAPITSGGGGATVTGVTVSPATATVARNGTLQFTATVNGTNNPAQTVTWTVSTNQGNVNNTSISAAGLLTVGPNQNPTTLTIRATSTADTTKSGTATVTVPPPGQTGEAGILTVTNIPSQYNGKYAAVQGYTTNAEVEVYGVEYINFEVYKVTFVQISNGQVKLPMWLYNEQNDSFTRYYGNHTFTFTTPPFEGSGSGIAFFIYETPGLEGQSGPSQPVEPIPPDQSSPIPPSPPSQPEEPFEPLVQIAFQSVSFSNGSAQVSFNNGIPFEIDIGPGPNPLPAPVTCTHNGREYLPGNHQSLPMGDGCTCKNIPGIVLGGIPVTNRSGTLNNFDVMADRVSTALADIANLGAGYEGWLAIIQNNMKEIKIMPGTPTAPTVVLDSGKYVMTVIEGVNAGSIASALYAFVDTNPQLTAAN